MEELGLELGAVWFRHAERLDYQADTYQLPPYIYFFLKQTAAGYRVLGQLPYGQEGRESVNQYRAAMNRLRALLNEQGE